MIFFSKDSTVKKLMARTLSISEHSCYCRVPNTPKSCLTVTFRSAFKCTPLCIMITFLFLRIALLTGFINSGLGEITVLHIRKFREKYFFLQLIYNFICCIRSVLIITLCFFLSVCVSIGL